MSQRNVDLQKLLQFQTKSLQFCDSITQLSAFLIETVGTASEALQDDVAKKALSEASAHAVVLQAIGRKGSEMMSTYLMKTKRDIDSWAALNS